MAKEDKKIDDFSGVVDEKLDDFDEKNSIDIKKKNVFSFQKYCKSSENFRIVILGRTGSGKTVFAQKLIHEIQHRKKRNIIICDTKFEFDNVETFEVHDFLKKGVKRKIRTIEIDGKIYESEKEMSEYSCALGWVWAPSITYIEEISGIVSRHDNIPRTHLNLYRILQRGRSRKADFVCCSQEVSQINKTLLRQATDVFLFAITPFEAQFIEKLLGLAPHSLKFELPNSLELEKPVSRMTKSERKDLYKFYRISPDGSVLKYESIPYKKAGRPKKKTNASKKVGDIQVKPMKKENNVKTEEIKE